MKLVASLITRNEHARYLKPCVEHLRAFCNQIRVLDDASTDGGFDWLAYQPKVEVLQLPAPRFFEHEGRARQALIQWTLEEQPDWVLSLDADEFVSDGAVLRRAIANRPSNDALSLEICEVWNADADHLWIRQDGGWRSHPLTCLWYYRQGGSYQMLDKQLACRRVPRQVLEIRNVRRSGVDLLHFGWTDPETRQQRYDRYMQIDAGKFHARTHLQSIMWPENKMRLERRDWPRGEVFDGLRERFSKAAA